MPTLNFLRIFSLPYPSASPLTTLVVRCLLSFNPIAVCVKAAAAQAGMTRRGGEGGRWREAHQSVPENESQ
ncbi:hypothetical protein E2C01_031861 [Portunus trituberculatus]|uniref:Uncharacterized protein n=1 Tax=Portunus trituberculatus TaxID=210409 RepID=A0A5B7EZ06_PORTR|nr:hypothetical protein [Portunus trituberculatus]